MLDTLRSLYQKILHALFAATLPVTAPSTPLTPDPTPTPRRSPDDPLPDYLPPTVVMYGISYNQKLLSVSVHSSNGDPHPWLVYNPHTATKVAHDPTEQSNASYELPEYNFDPTKLTPVKVTLTFEVIQSPSRNI